jgi:hypothetical protein
MLTPSEREAIEKGYLTLKIIWVAMLGLLPIYVIVCHLFGDLFGFIAFYPVLDLLSARAHACCALHRA